MPNPNPVLQSLALDEDERKELARKAAEATKRSEDNARMKGGGQ